MKKTKQPTARIEITKDGPYLVSGGLPLSEQWIATNAEGESLDYREGKKYPAQPQYALCRCGQSANKPFCDGTHKKVQFDGTETASRQPYLEQAETIEGPTMLLTDQENLCAFARFCDPKGRVWNLVLRTDDPKARRLVEYRGGPLSRWAVGGLGSSNRQAHRTEIQTVARVNRGYREEGKRPDLGARRHPGGFRRRKDL